MSTAAQINPVTEMKTYCNLNWGWGEREEEVRKGILHRQQAAGSQLPLPKT